MPESEKDFSNLPHDFQKLGIGFEEDIIVFNRTLDVVEPKIIRISIENALRSSSLVNLTEKDIILSPFNAARVLITAMTRDGRPWDNPMELKQTNLGEYSRLVQLETYVESEIAKTHQGNLEYVLDSTVVEHTEEGRVTTMEFIDKVTKRRFRIKTGPSEDEFRKTNLTDLNNPSPDELGP